jgi:G3E family GTPase
MGSTRLVLVGGFLGAGKTTWIEAAARRLVARGLKPAVITNDQAVNLVDTGTIERAGLPVAEVAGGCFCCRFEDLTGAALKLKRNFDPDVMLAEPVGSCTDLSATDMQPLKQYFSATLSPAPFSVLMDPDRFRDCIAGGSACALPEDARYILDKQVEEADVLLLNKADRLGQEEQIAVERMLTCRFPGRDVRVVSAASGAGVDDWLDMVLTDQTAGGRIVDVDYDRYADGEAALGWLNATVQVAATDGKADWEGYGRRLFGRFHERFRNAGAEVAHLKMALVAAGGRLQISLTGTKREPGFRIDGGLSGPSAVLTVNARVAASPKSLREIVEDEVNAYDPTFETDVVSLTCFSPSRPLPVHRFDRVV